MDDSNSCYDEVDADAAAGVKSVQQTGHCVTETAHLAHT